jgi:hypothetical protein
MLRRILLAVGLLRVHQNADNEALDFSLGVLLCRVPRVSMERTQGGGKDDGAGKKVSDEEIAGRGIHNQSRSSSLLRSKLNQASGTFRRQITTGGRHNRPGRSKCITVAQDQPERFVS